MSNRKTPEPFSGRKFGMRPRSQRKFLSQPLTLEECGPPRVLAGLLLTIGGLVGGLVIWAAVTELPENSTSRGQIMPAGSVHIVQHLEGGIVAGIPVEEGQIVERGETLVRFDSAGALAELEQLRAREVGLALKAARLRAFVDGVEPDFSTGASFAGMVEDQVRILEAQRGAQESQASVLQARIKQREAELEALHAQRRNLQEQADILKEQMSLREPLVEQGIVSRAEYLETRQAHAKIVGEIASAVGAVARVGEALNEAHGALVELRTGLDSAALEQMGETSAELAEVREQLANLEDRVSRLEVRAPSRGIVKGLAVNTLGAVVAPGQMLLEIVPVDDEMVAEVRVSPRDIGHLRLGQSARVNVTTYDIARYGSVSGHLSRLSASTFQTDDGEPYYRATIELDQNFVGSDSGRNLVLPGMEVDAEIGTGSKSLLRYLLKPIYRSLDTAFEER